MVGKFTLAISGRGERQYGMRICIFIPHCFMSNMAAGGIGGGSEFEVTVELVPRLCSNLNSDGLLLRCSII